MGRLLLKRLGLLLVVVVAVVASYVATVGPRLFPDSASVVVYGHRSGQATEQLLDGLQARGVPYHFAAIEAPLVSTEMRWKLGAGFQDRYRLPLVQVLGNRHERPDAELIGYEYEQAVRRDGAPSAWPWQRLLAALVAAVLLAGMLMVAIRQRRRQSD